MNPQNEPKRQQYTKPVLRVVDFKPEERLMACNKLPFSACTTQKES